MCFKIIHTSRHNVFTLYICVYVTLLFMENAFEELHLKLQFGIYNLDTDFSNPMTYNDK